MDIRRIYTNSKVEYKEPKKSKDEMIIELRRKNEQLEKRVHELEIWLEEAIATLQNVL